MIDMQLILATSLLVGVPVVVYVGMIAGLIYGISEDIAGFRPSIKQLMKQLWPL